MTSRPPRRGALLLRFLGVLGVVVGVFAMHGLTAHHDAVMAELHPPAAPHPAALQHSVVPEPHQVHLPIALVDAIDRVVIEPAAEQHGMSEACMAVLTALFLLLALVLAMRSLLAWRPALLAAPAGRVVLSEHSPPWLTPSLSKLRVLRI